MDFRCDHTLHFKRFGDVIETKCKAKRCGAGGGNVVLHRWNLNTGELVETLKFKDPTSLVKSSGLSEQPEASSTTVLFTHSNHPKEEQDGGSTSHRSAVRSA